MKNPKTLFLITLLLCVCVKTTAQINFSEELIKDDPVTDRSLSFDQKETTYQAHLEAAKEQNDSLKILFGYLHLFHNYINYQKYEQAMACVLEAEKLAENSGNSIWKGQVLHCKGTLYFYLKNYDRSIASFELALTQSGKGLDSQNVAITLEQLGSVYSIIDDYEVSNKYYEKAIPLIKKFCKDVSLAITLENYGNLMSYQGKSNEAIEAYEEAIGIYRKIKNELGEAGCMHNMADEYLRLGQGEEALRRYKICIQNNENKPRLLDLLRLNYKGISEVYEYLGRHEESIVFLKKYYELNETQIGTEVQTKIADLQAQYVKKEQELALQKKEINLLSVKKKIERGIAVFITLVLIGLFTLWRWHSKKMQAEQTLKESKQNLQNITQLLIAKNAHLAVLEEKVKGNKVTKKENESTYNKRILTDSDWMAFKTYFESRYPNFIYKLRLKYANLSEAEERLFLLLKLHLSSKEIADILGISLGGVKKTRYRLRKRLNMQTEQPLETFIQSCQM